MARLILKSPYIKSTSGASGYLRYIATRERVELIPDDRPPTRKQEQLVAKLVKDFPDSKTLYEYEDYLTKPTKVSASTFITLALESNWDAIHESEQYMKYIATRPRAERIGAHGLFGDKDAVSLEKAMEELESYSGNVWTHIISLKREDAVRLGFDNAAAWRNLIRAHRNDIAAAMKIPPGDFRWYAAFHDEGEHPHIHLMAWSAKPGQAYLSKEGIRQIKSKLTNDIFRNEMLHLYEQKSESRDELVRESRRAMLELVHAMQDGVCDHPDAEQLMLELAAQLETVKGKKSYGYLPKRLKALVDEIVDEMERLPVVSKCYDQWLMLQGKVDSYYHDKPQERIPLSQQKEFRQIKNAVIQEAERLHMGEITFEEKGLNQQDEPEEYRNASYDYWTLRDIIRDESLTMEKRSDAVSEMDKLAESDDRYAQYLMGKLWRDGPLLIPNAANARYWFEQAAEQGHLAAQYSLAKLYLSGDGEVQDIRLGLNWLYTAAVNGSSYAMYRLAKEPYVCNRYASGGKNACSSHYINQKVLTQIVMTDIRCKAMWAQNSRETLRTQLLAREQNASLERTRTLQAELNAIGKRLPELDKLIQSVYEDKVLGRIPESVCVNLLNQYEAERREKQERHKELTGQLAASRETESSVDAWLDMMQDYAQLEELDRPTLVRLIQKIEISERYSVDDHEERDIHIYYNFVGYIEA